MPDTHFSIPGMAIPYAFPLDDFYSRAGRPLPEIERVSGETMPEPYRSLLVHEKDMTPTLERFHGVDVHLRIFEREERGEFYFRQVALCRDDNDRPVEFGANKVSLLLFPPKARHLILEARLPLGSILRECEIPHLTHAKAFFRIRADEFIGKILSVKPKEILYGRRATISDLKNRPLSEIVEILPPESVPAHA